MKIISEFREFISRGSMVDLAVGVILGAAYGKIVSTLVDQVIMPPIGLLMGGVDFADLKIVLKAADAAAKKPEVAVQYGVFINAIIQFVIIGATVFLLVKMVNTIRRFTASQEEAGAAKAAPTPSETLLMEIRDLLKAQTVAKAPAQTAKATSAQPAHQKRSTPAKRS
jgi:large conductance mechanosensitive channel